ncbi:MAG: four helix bundle protein [Planctomycetota bacterium]
MYDTFEAMPVWQKAHTVVLKIWELTAAFPSEELYILVSQIRRSVLSISANIAEGFGRHHALDKIKFYLNARGSLYETINHLLVAKDLGYINNKTYSLTRELLEEIAVELNKLIKTLRPKSTSLS